jgi:hypothetical protein
MDPHNELLAAFLDSLQVAGPLPQVEKLSEDIYGLQLLGLEECDRLTALAQGLHYDKSELIRGHAEGYRTSKDIFIDSLGNEVSNAFARYAMPLLNHLTAAVWNWEFNQFSDLTILKYEVGDYYKEHVDASEANLCSRRHLSFLIYLSDNFEGGQTNFRRQNICVKPHRGFAVVFPSGITHPHESLVVTAGVKYAICGWLTRT